MKSYLLYDDGEGSTCFEVFETKFEYGYIEYLKRIGCKIIEYGLYCDENRLGEGSGQLSFTCYIVAQ